MFEISVNAHAPETLPDLIEMYVSDERMQKIIVCTTHLIRSKHVRTIYTSIINGRFHEISF